jgi:hydroxyacylglutathione hydrolase
MESQIKTINLGFVNAYLLQTENNYILIDTGISQFWSKLESELLSLGCRPERLKLVILTHGDMDHAGNCKIFQHKYGVNIAMHSGDIEMVTSGRSIPRSTDTFSGKLIQWISSIMKDISNFFEPNLYHEDGQTLKEFGIDAFVIHISGHTPGPLPYLPWRVI